MIKECRPDGSHVWKLLKTVSAELVINNALGSVALRSVVFP